MLDTAGSIASLVGAGLAIPAFGFALLQLRALRGETRAAKEAAERAGRTLTRGMVIADIARRSEQIEVLKGLHRNQEWTAALYSYHEIQRGLIGILVNHPQLPEDQRVVINRVVTELGGMQRDVETLTEDELAERIGDFNQKLTGLQLFLFELEARLVTEIG